MVDRPSVEHTGHKCFCRVHKLENGKIDPDHYEMHLFCLPEYGEPLWYVTVGSFNAYNNRRVKEFVNDKQRRTSTIRYVEDDFGLVDLAGATAIQHKNLWAFYKYIGYDHRKNKFQPLAKES